MDEEHYEDSDHEYDETDETGKVETEDPYKEAGVEELEEEGEADAAGFMRGYNEAAEEKPDEDEEDKKEE